LSWCPLRCGLWGCPCWWSASMWSAFSCGLWGCPHWWSASMWSSFRCGSWGSPCRWSASSWTSMYAFCMPAFCCIHMGNHTPSLLWVIWLAHRQSSMSHRKLRRSITGQGEGEKLWIFYVADRSAVQRDMNKGWIVWISLRT
jgi:hypothetical protein